MAFVRETFNIKRGME